MTLQDIDISSVYRVPDCVLEYNFYFIGNDTTYHNYFIANNTLIIPMPEFTADYYCTDEVITHNFTMNGSSTIPNFITTIDPDKREIHIYSKNISDIGYYLL